VLASLSVVDGIGIVSGLSFTGAIFGFGAGVWDRSVNRNRSTDPLVWSQVTALVVGFFADAGLFCWWLTDVV